MDTTTQDTLIQVWGLWRSGTNFVEYLIRNNIKYNNYERRQAYNRFSGKQDALKHCYPDASKATYHIGIYKELGDYVGSHETYNRKKVEYPIDAWLKWQNVYSEFNDGNPNSVMIPYKSLLGKELWWFREWQNQGWQIEFNDIWQVPLKRMGRESGTDFE